MNNNANNSNALLGKNITHLWCNNARKTINALHCFRAIVEK